MSISRKKGIKDYFYGDILASINQNMKNLESALKEYLKLKGNHAFLITGKWGSGKTFYYKNNLTKIITSTPTVNDHSKNYKSIHISLFGLKTIEEIQTQIFLSLRPILNNKIAKLSMGLGKSIVRGILSIQNLGNVDDYISDVKPETGDWIQIEDLVICFDDLERASIPIDLLIGYINSLVENNDAKIIIIANENKIDNQDYSDLKEKVVGISIEFISDFKEKIKNIIDTRYGSSFSVYADHLKDKISYLSNQEDQFDQNLRVLIFALDKYHLIFSEIHNNLDSSKNQDHIIYKNWDNIFRFTVGIASEYKKNKISFSNRCDLEKAGGFADIADNALALLGEENADAQTYRDWFLSAYFKDRNNYVFYEELYSYIVGATGFDFKKFESEIKKFFHIDKDEMDPSYQVLNGLHFQYVLKMDDKTYKVQTKKLIEYAENGEFGLQDYLTVFYYGTRLNNPNNYKPKKLKTRIQRGIKNISEKAQYIPTLDFYLDVPSSSPYKKQLEEIKKTSLEQNEIIKRKTEKSRALEFLKKFEDNWIDFQFELLEKFENTPIFKYGSPHKIYLNLNNANLEKLRDFETLIKTRYSKDSSYYLKDEIDFLKELKGKIEPKSNNRKKNNLKNYFLDRIFEELKKAIDNLN